MPGPRAHPFDALTPDCLLDALAEAGFDPDGHFLALNSYENRVYQIGRFDGPPVVAKFYRPERWSEPCILEEHAFALELAEHEIPVAVPLVLPNGRTLGSHHGFGFAVFERLSGREPELDMAQTRVQVGRFLGRIHAIGATRRFLHRPDSPVATVAADALAYLRRNQLADAHVAENYYQAAQTLLDAVRELLDAHEDPVRIRLHGDIHRGNILYTQSGPGFVDLDDCVMGPAVQDLWMLLSGNRDEMQGQIADILQGYRQFHHFDTRELAWIEALRGLRFLTYAAWLGRRWSDPAFPKAFPWFADTRFWEEQTQTLREQLERLAEAPIELI